jgi:hypothetical protein
MVTKKLLKQITLFAENKPGRLTSATKILSENGINVRAFTIADSGNLASFGSSLMMQTRLCAT